MSIHTELPDSMAVMHAKHSRALVQPVENKQAIRAQLEAHMKEFFAGGGSIQECGIRVDAPGKKAVSNFAIQCNSDRSLSNTPASRYIGIPASTLRQLCCEGCGPKHTTVRKGVRLFQIPDLDAWKESMIAAGEWKW